MYQIWCSCQTGSSTQSAPIPSQIVHDRFSVLRYIALFKRFGYAEPVIDEAKTLSAIIREGYPLITWQKFQEIIVDIRNRKILQGETTLYISPKLLHIKLWADWWDWRAVSSLTEYQS